MGEKLYGQKCHKCGCLRHDGEYAAPVIAWLRRPRERLLWCADCDSCQEHALHEAIFDGGLDLFGPEVRAAVKAFHDGTDHPLLDSLRDECLTIEAELSADEGAGSGAGA